MAELPKDIQEIADKKQEYIDKNRDKLESNVIKMQEDLLNRLLEDILPELETKDGQILNTQKNMRLIEVLDSVYAQFNETTQTKTVKTLGETLTGLSKFNNKYFGSLVLNEVGKKRFDSVSKKTDELMKTTIGINKDGSVYKGGFLDSFITDNTLLTELKQMLIRNVTGQQSLAEFRKSLKEKVVGTKNSTGGFERYYRQYAYDVYQNYDRAYAKTMADEFQLNYAIYQGGLIKDSRDFCKAHEGKVFTREEISEFSKWKLPKDSVESPGPGQVPSYIAKFPNYDPFTHLAGFQCRHSLSWITKSMAERLRPELKKK